MASGYADVHAEHTRVRKPISPRRLGLLYWLLAGATLVTVDNLTDWDAPAGTAR